MQRRKKTLIDRLERRFGKYAIKDLMKYASMAYIIGVILQLIATSTGVEIYYNYLSLDFYKILHGQIWRLVTFVIMPPSTITGGTDAIWCAVEIYMYYIFGQAIENTIGSFRFNLYFFNGIILNILAGLIMYIVTGVNGQVGFFYVNRIMLLVLALLYPTMEFLLFFIIPVKAKWIAVFDGALIIFDFVRNLRNSILCYNSGIVGFVGFVVYGTMALSIVMSVLNFILFYISLKNKERIIIPHKNRARKKQFKKSIKQSDKEMGHSKGARHKCCICGRTELDDPDLQFRYCSKCKGNYEYCSDHLFTHEHKK